MSMCSGGGTRALALFLVLILSSAAATAANLEGHGGPVKAISISAQGRGILTGSFDYSVILWSLEGEEATLVRRFDEHEGAVNAVEFVPGTEWAVSAGDVGPVRLWNLKTGELVHSFEGHTHKVVDLAVSSDGRYVASAGWDRTVRLWDLDGFKEAGVLTGHRDRVNAVEFSADGTVLYSGGVDGAILQWNVEQAVMLRRLYRYGWGVNVLGVLPDNTSILFGAIDGTVNILDIAGGEIERTLTTHKGPVLSMFVAARYGIAAAGGGDGKIHVWNVADWSVVKQHENPYGPVWAMAPTPDGRSVYYGTLDDFAVHWNMIPGQPFEPVASEFPRRFQVKAEADPGELQFARKCSICHTLTPGGGNRAGPTLYKLFGRRAGTLPGYPYSDALKKSDIVWNEATIGRLFGDGPQEVVPGTKMPLQKMTNAEERDALIAFLKEATGSQH